jgi:hypothetical protein
VAKRRPGEEVQITYDWNGPADKAPETGDVLRSPGSCYLILNAERVNSTVHPHRLKLKAVVINCGEVQRCKVFDLRWNPRGKK